MPVTTRPVTNVGSPPDDPLLLLPGTLYIPDSGVHPPPWPCVVATVADNFQNNNQGSLSSLNAPLTDLANAGFLCLAMKVRLAGTQHPLPGQTTDGCWHQQTDDLKIGIVAMRNNPFGFGYSVTGWVAAFGGSGGAHHAIYCAIDGTVSVDKADAALALSPVTDMGNWTLAQQQFIDDVVLYGRTNVLATLTARSPIALALAGASPIRHYNGDAEIMPVVQLTGFQSAMAIAGAVGYVSIENTGTLGTKHSVQMWTGIRNDSITWLLSVVTPPPPPIPNAPSLLTATVVSTSEIDLGWTDNSINEDGFRIERSLDNTIWSEIFVTGSNVVVYNDTGLSSGTLYYYRARAFNITGDSAYSNTASATTQSPLPTQLNTPTYTPSGSPDSNTDVTIACSDTGSHIFYTIGVSPPGPPDPTHTGDLPTGTTFRIGSNSGVVNSSGGVTQLKSLAYQSGFTDSDIAVSDTFGTPPVGNLQPILTGIGQLLPSDLVGQRLGDTSGYLAWHDDFVDFFRYRAAWDVMNPTEDVYDWTMLDPVFALAAANNKFISLSIAAGLSTPQWVYDAGAFKYQMHNPDDAGFLPPPWDTIYQAKWFKFLNALAIRYSANSQLRAMIDSGFMPQFGMQMGDTTDEDNLDVIAKADGYVTVHDAYRAAAQNILATTFSLFPSIGHAITYEQVWPDDHHKDTNFVRDWYRATYPGRAGTIITSLRATLPPHIAPDPNTLQAYPQYAQQFRPMTTVPGPNHYTPQPDPVPLPPPLQVLQDCLENAWTTGKQYLEVYRPDIEFSGAGPTFLIEQKKLKTNLLGVLPPTCPSGQHWDANRGECVPDFVPPPPVDFHGPKPILENAQLSTDIDFQNHYLLNPGLLIPCPEGLLEFTDVRLSDARTIDDNSITNDSVNINAAIDQSKLNFNREIPNVWLGTTITTAAPGNNVEYLSNKNQPQGYVGLDANRRFSASQLSSTGPETGTVTEIFAFSQDPFTLGSSTFGDVFILLSWTGFPNNTWLGVNGGLGFEKRLVPSILSSQVPTSIVPDIPATKFTTGTFDRDLMPIAIGMGVGHAPGFVPDTGNAITVGSESDYLGRDMLWHSFQDIINPQPTAPDPNIILQSYYLGKGSIRIRSLLEGSNLFYRVISSFVGTPFQKAPTNDFTLLVDVGKRVDAYVAKAGYNNSEVVSFTVPPIPTG